MDDGVQLRDGHQDDERVVQVEEALKTAMTTAQPDGGHDVHDSEAGSVGVVEGLGLLDADDDVAVDDSGLLLVGELEARGRDAVEVA